MLADKYYGGHFKDECLLIKYFGANLRDFIAEKQNSTNKRVFLPKYLDNWNK